MYKETNLVILNSGGTTPVINSQFMDVSTKQKNQSYLIIFLYHYLV